MAGLCDTAAQAQVRVTGEAFAGEPFGVGRIELDLPNDLLPEPLGGDGLGLQDRDGRLFYPTLDESALTTIAKEVVEGTPLLRGGPVRQQIRGLVGELLDRPPRRTIYFLFRGQEPLHLVVQARTDLVANLSVASDPAAHQQLMARWWQQYTAAPGWLEKKPDYPPLVQTFLKATLGRRLGLALPEREQSDTPADLLAHEAGLLAGAESVRMAMLQDRVLGLTNLGQTADQPLPELPPLPPLQYPAAPADVEIEPLAARVPQECFYVRFGSFNNFLWLQDTLARFNGDLQNLVAARGIDYGMKRRIESQLGLQTTALSRLFGDAVIADVAVVGTDTFFQDTASFGLLFLARNNFAVGTNFAQQRRERLAAAGAKEEKVMVAGREVSYIYTPDGSLRSYYVVDGDFHFVTTSRTLVRRFLETADGKSSLAACEGFRHARAQIPLKRDDTIFIYLCDAFFENLASPGYRIEMIRRLQAATDIQAVQLAVLAAAAEGKSAASIADLISGGFLPPDFGPLPDGSRVIMQGGTVRDEMRGALGGFLPAADMTANAASSAEAKQYLEFADYYRSHWGRMDPTIIAIHRGKPEGNLEHVTVDMQLSPFAAEHFRFLSQWAGPADPRRAARIPGDVVRLELAAKDGQYIAAGLRDMGLPLDLASGGWLPLLRIRDWFVGYIATTQSGGLLGFLSQPVVEIPRPGQPRLLVGFAGVTAPGSPFTVYSLQPEIAHQVASLIHFEPAERPAQLRLDIGDVAHSQLSEFVNKFVYKRTVDTTLGNLRLLHALEQQLHMPAPECLSAADYLLGGTLVCPLGGKYVLVETGNRAPHWTSTALQPEGPTTMLPVPPQGYRAPFISWIGGLTLDAGMVEKLLTAHAELTMEMPPMPKETP